MIRYWLNLVLSGNKTIDDVPEKWRTQVKEAYDAVLAATAQNEPEIADDKPINEPKSEKDEPINK